MCYVIIYIKSNKNLVGCGSVIQTLNTLFIYYDYFILWKKRMVKILTTGAGRGFGSGFRTGDSWGCLCLAPNSAGPLLSISMFSIIP